MSAAVRQAFESFGARVTHARWSAAQVMSELCRPELGAGLEHEPDPREDDLDDDAALHRHFPRP